MRTLIVLGDVGVGKASIVNRHLGNAFQVQLGVQYLKSLVECRGSRMELRI
jgi:GTPase SAR1 family protein